MASKTYSTSGGSWFDPDRRKPSPPELGYQQDLIGMIYFSTNDRALDRNDLDVLHKLSTFVTTELAHDRPVVLSLVGMADARGRASYNKWLSEQRVKAVANRLGRLTRIDRPYFTGVWAAAIGEEQAMSQFVKDCFYRSLDRAVAIWWGRPKMHIMPKLRWYSFGKGYLDEVPGHDHLIDLAPPSRPRPIGYRDGLIDL